MKLFVTNRTKQDFDKVPENERIFYLMCGQLFNDLGTFHKLIMYAQLSTKRDNQIKRSANGSVNLFLLRLLAGRLYEGWNFINGNYFKTRSIYRDKLTEKGASAHEKLCKFFGQKNLIKDVRHLAAFHSDVGLAMTSYAAIPDNERMPDYISEVRAFTYFASAHALDAMSLITLSSVEGDYQAKLDQLGSTLIEISGVMSWFIQDWMTVFLSLHFPDLQSPSSSNNQIELDLDIQATEQGFDFFMTFPNSFANES